MNQLSIIGNLTADPIQRQAGTHTVCEFTVAVNESRDRTVFIPCEAWDKTCESVMRLKKGSKVGLSGSVSQSQWQDRETGKNRSRLFMKAARVTYCDRRESQPQPGYQQAPPPYPPQGTGQHPNPYQATTGGNHV